MPTICEYPKRNKDISNEPRQSLTNAHIEISNTASFNEVSPLLTRQHTHPRPASSRFSRAPHAILLLLTPQNYLRRRQPPHAPQPDIQLRPPPESAPCTRPVPTPPAKRPPLPATIPAQRIPRPIHRRPPAVPTPSTRHPPPYLRLT